MVEGGKAVQMRRLDALQSLRGIAATIVLFRHAMLTYPVSRNTDMWLGVLFNSHAAVVVFFVLSGFVLATSLDGRECSASVVLDFYIKRIFRILPLLVVITTVSLGFTLTRFSAIEVPGTTSFFQSLLRHCPVLKVPFILGLFGMNSLYVPQNWTIMVELLVAPLFPFMFFLARARALALFVMLAISTTASLVARQGGHWLPVVYTNDFLIGIAVFLLWSRAATISQAQFAWAAAFGLPVLIGVRPMLMALHVSFLDLSNFHEPVSGLIEGLAAGGLVLALAGQSGLARLLSKAKLVFLGDVSYSLYLVHFFVLVIAVRLVGFAMPGFADLGGVKANAILAVGVFGLSAGLSTLLYWYLELSFNRFGRRLAKFQRASSAADGPVTQRQTAGVKAGSLNEVAPG